MVQAHAFLGNRQVSHTFRFNPDAAQWDYTNNTASTDTIGGRVVQLLSVSINGIAVQGKAGSRSELQRLADNVKSIMNFHVRTSSPVQFRVPSRNWNFLVYVQAMPQIGWDVAATSYPYQLQLAVEEDLTGVKTRQLGFKALEMLADGIGYNPAVHGGNTGAFNDLVDTVLKLSPETVGGGGSGVGAGGGFGGPLGTLEGWTSGLTTQPIIAVIEAILDEFPRGLRSQGTYNCKKTAGGSFSQHSAGNALDVTGTTEALDRLFNFLKSNIGRGKNLPISQVIWRDHCLLGPECDGSFIDGHDTHIHISGLPYRTTPIPGCNP